MRIHLMRHGQCLSRELNPHRPLSPVGRELTMKSARAASMLGLRFQLIASAPAPRAQQTAEIMAMATDYPMSRIAVSDVFKPTAPASEAVEFINEYHGLDDILVTGHLPSLGLIAARLLDAKGLELALDNSGLTQIIVPTPDAPGLLGWHLTPAQLALIGGT